METSTGNGLDYLLCLSTDALDKTGGIRHWPALKIARSETEYWIKGFQQEQLESAEILCIANAKVYQQQDGLLFEKGMLTPSRKMPANLLWHPLISAVKVDRPAYNNNYFGVDQKLTVQLVPSEIEENVGAALIGLNELKSYCETAAATRLQKLQWIILNQESALVVGTPLLPMLGKTYWQVSDMLLPTGKTFQYDHLIKLLPKAMKLADENAFCLWNESGSYALISKNDLKPLTRSSVRKALKGLEGMPS